LKAHEKLYLSILRDKVLKDETMPVEVKTIFSDIEFYLAERSYAYDALKAMLKLYYHIMLRDGGMIC